MASLARHALTPRVPENLAYQQERGPRQGAAKPWYGRSMDEMDIWRTAKILIASYGQDASTEATIRADEALREGQPDGVNVWMRVMRAVCALQQPKPSGGELLN